MVNKKNKNRSTIDPRKGKKDPLADLKASERRKKKLKEQGSFNKGGTPGGIGSHGKRNGSWTPLLQKQKKLEKNF